MIPILSCVRYALVVSNLRQQVGATIRRHRLIPDGTACVVAVSGGLDSVALLRLLCLLGKNRGWRLHVAHFNHRLRGRAADADERFVRRLADELGLPATVGRADVRAHARRHRSSIETAARDLRHAFLAQVARESGAERIALGHHANDQTETFFLRLLRGSGGAGLGGMQFDSPSPADPSVRLVRPLLETPRTAIADFARSQRLRWREDATNRDEQVLRNWLRRRVLPLLEAKTRGAIHRLVSRTAQMLVAEAQLSRAAARDWLRRHPRRPPFGELLPAVQRQVVAAQLTALGVEAGFEVIERLRLQANEAVTTSVGLLQRDATGELHAAEVAAPAFADTGRTVVLRGESGRAEFDGVRIRWRRRTVPRGWVVPQPVAGREFLDARAVGGRLELRHWQVGDRFQPIGLGRPAKLQDLFTNAKVPRGRRHALVVACAGDRGIVWVEGLRLGETAKVGPATRRVIEWRWER